MIRLDRPTMSLLHTGACDAMRLSHQDARREIQLFKLAPSTHETVFVAHLCRATSQIARDWTAVLAKASSGYRLSIATVFTHQTPRVAWSAGGVRQVCELADLLIVVIDRTRQQPKGRAILIQAKLSPSNPFSCAGQSARKQFDLLSARPKFDVVAKAAPTGIDLGPYAPDSALLYGLTDVGVSPIPSGLSGIHYWVTADQLRRAAGTYSAKANHCLAFTMTGMLTGRWGWDFDLPPPGADWKTLALCIPRDDWSVLIAYLLEETFMKTLSKAHRRSMGRDRRGQVDSLNLAASNQLGQPMFFIGRGLGGFEELPFGAGDAEDANIDWKPTSLEGGGPIFGGGDASGGDRGFLPDGGPGDGPINLVLIEIGKQDE